MHLLILNGPRDSRPGNNPLYRGTYRAHPSHCDELSDDQEINQLFFWFLQEGGELGVVRDLHKALRFAELWNTRLTKDSRRFEVVEVIEHGHPLCGTDRTFIGFDLSAGYNNSLLSSGLRKSLGANQPRAVRTLYDSLSQVYSPQLNVYGLFQNWEVASPCLRAMSDLQELSPNFFEGGNLDEFRVVGLYSVMEQPTMEI